jgi:DNA-binding SARP family transcriptional activator
VAGATALRVDLFGGFNVRVDGRSIARLPSARQQQLITFLVLHGRANPIPRQRVSGTLWPESTDVQAQTNLRRELHHLREAWPRLEALIASESRTLAWGDHASAMVDVVAFERAADRGLEGDRAALQEAATLYQGDLLPDCQDEWIQPDRERLQQRAREVLGRLVTSLEQDRSFGEAIERGRQLLRLDPLDEQAWCALMRCHARQGDRATALHLYQECAALLKKELGVQPSAATRITYREILDLDPSELASQPPARTAVYPLVGRQTEWRSMVDTWQAAAGGHMRLLVVRGEAGIGKSRLAEELTGWAGVNGVAAASARCYAGEARLAYAPIADWLKSDVLRAALTRLEPAWMTDVARLSPSLLAGRPDVAAPEGQLESWQRLRFFEALTQAFRSAAPIVLVLDDLQWADGDTIEWLHYFVRSATDAKCLVVGTVRAEEEHDNQPLVRLLRQLEHDHLLTVISLGPLDRTATAQLAGQVAGHPLDETMLARTFRETEGHPLFIIERGRMEWTSQSTATDHETPSQVQAVVAARLALLSDDARAAAEVAASIGRDFSFDILAQASDLEEDALVRALDELWRRHIVRVQADDRWDFSHDRIREVAYSGIGPARRRLIHRRIAQGMEILFADRLDDASASIAAHLDRGGQSARALPFIERAAAVAERLSAVEEAIRCLTYALALLDKLPSGRDRDEHELKLRSSLSVALNSGRGYAAPEVEHNLDRVFALSRADRGHVPVRWLWVAYTLKFMLGDLEGMRAISEEALERSVAEPSCRCEAAQTMGATLQTIGELAESKRYFDEALAAYDEEHPQSSALGSDLGVFTYAWSTHTLWLLGDETGAVSRADYAIALAQRRDHKYSETLAFAYASLLHQLRLDTEQTLRCADVVVELCKRYGFAYYNDWASVLIGWARGQDNPAEGVAIIESALERLDRARALARRPYYLSLLAQVYSRLPKRDHTRSIVDRAIAMALERGEVWWLPALYLQRSELEIGSEREATLLTALTLARSQQSRTLEQRILSSSIAASSR